MKKRFKLKNFYTTTLLSDIDVWNINDTTEYSFVVNDTVPSGPLYIIVNPQDESKRDIIYIHRVSWNNFYYYQYNRSNPSVAHIPWATISVNDFAEYFNYIFRNIDDFWDIKKWALLSVEVRWWNVSNNWVSLNIPDTTLTLIDNTTNYIVFDYTDNTIKNLTDLTNFVWKILQVVTTSWWEITNIEDKREIIMSPIFNPEDFIITNWKINIKKWWIYKVLSDSNDPSAWYLSDKVDWTTLEIDTTTHKIKVKDNVFADKAATQAALNAKEDAFEKHTAFNKDFWTTAWTVAEWNHTHNLADLAEKSYNSLTDKPDLSIYEKRVNNQKIVINDNNIFIYNLDKKPIANSVSIFINWIEQIEWEQYTVDYNNLSVTFMNDIWYEVWDIINIKYLY